MKKATAFTMFGYLLSNVAPYTAYIAAARCCQASAGEGTDEV